jgi:6,7-dimethyl-8-ribityllumazine synthase
LEILEGTRAAQDFRFGIVVSKFNELITTRLLDSAVETFRKCGALDQRIRIVRVPGAFEIPLVARQMAETHEFDAILCLGSIIRGETAHFDFICSETSHGIARAALDTGVPVIFGVLTTETVDQALERAGSPQLNRGVHAAQAAIEMASLMKKIRALKG